MGRTRRVQDGRITGESIHYSVVDDIDWKKLSTDKHRVRMDGAFIANKRILRRMKMKKLGVVIVICTIIFFAIYLVYGILVALGPRM